MANRACTVQLLSTDNGKINHNIVWPFLNSDLDLIVEIKIRT
jgi:hypothetical protein